MDPARAGDVETVPVDLTVYTNSSGAGTSSTKNGPAARSCPVPTDVIAVRIVLPGTSPWLLGN